LLAASSSSSEVKTADAVLRSSPWAEGVSLSGNSGTGVPDSIGESGVSLAGESGALFKTTAPPAPPSPPPSMLPVALDDVKAALLIITVLIVSSR
jgi:hypothetical protein